MTDLDFLDRYATGWTLNSQPHLIEGGSVAAAIEAEGGDGPEMDVRISKGWAEGETLGDAISANSLFVGMVWADPVHFHQVFGLSSDGVVARMADLIREDRADRERTWNEAQAGPRHV